ALCQSLKQLRKFQLSEFVAFHGFPSRCRSFAERKLSCAPKTEHSRVDQRQTFIAFFDNKDQRAAQVLPGRYIASFKYSFEIRKTNGKLRGIVAPSATLDAKIGLGHAARFTFRDTTRLDVDYQIFLILFKDVETVSCPHHMIRRADDACDRDAQIADGQLCVVTSWGLSCWK